MAELRVTLFDLRTLAQRAEWVADQMDAARAELNAATDRPTRKAGWRLDDAAGEVRRAAEALRATAEELAFILTVRSRPHCMADWGCCPEHGATLVSSGDRCRCRAPGCGRTWGWRRMSLPCDEPPAFRLVDDAHGGEGLVCAGHAIAGREQLESGRLLPLPGPVVVGDSDAVSPLQVGDRVAYAGREVDDRGHGRVEVGTQGKVTGTTEGFDGRQVVVVEWDGGAAGAYHRDELRLVGRAPAGEEDAR